MLSIHLMYPYSKETIESVCERVFKTREVLDKPITTGPFQSDFLLPVYPHGHSLRHILAQLSTLAACDHPMVSHDMPQCLTCQSELGEKQKKTCCPQRKASSAILCLSLNAKMQSSFDKTTATAALKLIASSS